MIRCESRKKSKEFYFFRLETEDDMLQASSKAVRLDLKPEAMCFNNVGGCSFE